MAHNRRTFLKVSAAVGGGLAIAGYVPAFGGSSAVSAAGSFEPNVWVRVNADDTVRIMLTQLEMGQGIMTALPMLVAEELDIDWKNVRTEWAGADRRYGNPNMGGVQMTAGSNSVRGYWRPMREAGATARAMLVTAAAKGWGVAEDTCSTESGSVVHKASGRRARYGSLVDQAAALPVPQRVTLKKIKDFTIAGKPLARLDVPEKVNGTAMFGIDVKRPNMLIARIARSPVFGGKVKTFDATRAKAIPGVKQVVPVSAGIAVAADDFFAATRGVQALDIVWDEGPLAKLTSAEITRQMAEKAQQPGAVARNDGNVAAALSSGAKTFERVFEVPFLAHACMEPMNCTADVRADGCDVWVPTQAQTASHQAAIAASGLPESKVKIHTTYLGGGFGRRGEADFVTDAVETSKAVGRPVKVVWTREDDIQHDFYRPATYIRIWGAVDASGTLVAWQQRIVQQSLLKRVNPQGLQGSKGVDRISVDGAATLPYDIPNLRVEYTEYDPGIPYGFWRSVGNSVNGYVTEAFFDELAAAAGKDPFELRRQLLAKAPRHRLVLEKVAEMAVWSKPVAQGRARGIAVHEAFGTIVGLVTEVSVAGGAIRVHKIDCAVDCGWTINPDTIKAQMEGGIVYGLTAALKGEITIQNGRVTQGNFNNYQMLRHNEMPVINVAIMQNEETPGGIGEPSTAAVAGSLVNAVAAATGKRIYRLPIRLT